MTVLFETFIQLFEDKSLKTERSRQGLGLGI